MLAEERLSTTPTAIPIVFRSDRKVQIEAMLRETHGKVYGPSGAAARLGLPATTLDSQNRALNIKKHHFK